MQFSCYRAAGEIGELGLQEQQERCGSAFSLFAALGEAGLEVPVEFGVLDKAMSREGRFEEENMQNTQVFRAGKVDGVFSYKPVDEAEGLGLGDQRDEGTSVGNLSGFLADMTCRLAMGA